MPRAGDSRTASSHIAAINPPSTCIVAFDSKRAFLITATYLDWGLDLSCGEGTLLKIARSSYGRAVGSETCITVSKAGLTRLLCIASYHLDRFIPSTIPSDKRWRLSLSAKRPRLTRKITILLRTELPSLTWDTGELLPTQYSYITEIGPVARPLVEDRQGRVDCDVWKRCVIIR